MLDIEVYGDYETAWCPGCGNFGILNAVKQALAASDIRPRDVLFVSGIGQAAKAPHYLKCNLFNGLHGRSLPVATGAKLANPELTLIVESGDGCNYGEGGNHFLAALRRNIDVTMLVHDNQIYGLTKGQASPTSEEGFVTKAQPQGVAYERFNPLAVAVAMQVNFAARGFARKLDHLADLIQQALAHPGFSLVDILQPCVSFNDLNTYDWYEERVGELPDDYDPTNWEAAIKTAMQWGDTIPVGVVYRNDRPPYGEQLDRGPLVGREVHDEQIEKLLQTFT
jgi:2-oxoglutarate ferredoxin oxidoreductase subunit beta